MTNIAIAKILFREFGKLPNYRGPDDPCDDPVEQGYGNALTNIHAALVALAPQEPVADDDAELVRFLHTHSIYCRARDGRLELAAARLAELSRLQPKAPETD